MDPAKLASLGLALDDVRTAITDLTTNAPQGSIEHTDRAFTIYDNSQLLSAAPWNDAIIAYRTRSPADANGALNGAPVRVRDIGVAIDAAENARLAAFANGKPAILLPITRVPGANVIATVDRIKAALPALQAAIPPVVHISVLSDRTQTICASVNDVQFTLLLTIGLVVAVIFIFLRSLVATHLLGDRAACPGGHPRGDVCARLQPGQPVAHGAHHRRGLRRRRRHRGAREHRAPRAGRAWSPAPPP